MQMGELELNAGSTFTIGYAMHEGIDGMMRFWVVGLVKINGL